MCSERDSPLEPFVLSAPGQPELARLTCGAHLGPPVLTRKQKRPRVNSLVCDRAAAFCAAGLPEALSWMSRLVTQAAKREWELARAHSQRLKQATLSLPGESVSRGFADRGALEGYPSHYTSLLRPGAINGYGSPSVKWSLVQVMAWHLFGAKPLPETMMTRGQLQPQKQTSFESTSQTIRLWHQCCQPAPVTVPWMPCWRCFRPAGHL